MKHILGDDKKPVQFSKLMVFICILIAVIGIFGSAVACISLFLSETVACAVITACGCIGTTAIVWSLKKSQAENTIKLYLYSYKEILKLKQENMDTTDELFSQMENNMIMKIDETINTSLTDSTTPIERQDVY